MHSDNAPNFHGDYTLTINGEGISTATTMPVVNPATEEVIAQAPACTREQLDAAVAAARKAFPLWKATPIAERKKLVVAATALMEQNGPALMALLTSEQGKPLDGAAQEIYGSAMWAQAMATIDIPVTVNEDSDAVRSETRYLPIGVVGAISPWNFPVLLAMWKVIHALIAGNTVVLKPSPFTPLTVLKIGELFRGVLPAGVLNVVSGGDELGPWMTEHPDIDKISFTGSTQTGRRVMQSAAVTLKRITLELGGNDPAIVFPDVNIDEVAPKLFWAAFRNNGQICIASKRVYIHKDIYEPLSRAIAAYARTVKIGNGAEPGTQIGPIQNRLQYQRVKGLIEGAQNSGLNFLLGGDIPQGKGYFLPITLIDNPPDDAPVVAEEAFGPVLPLLKFDDVDDVIRRANASPYGLAASVWSADLERAADVASRLECGTVWINDAQYLTPMASFAGHKQSGVGIENGLDGLLEYTIPQTVVVRKSGPAFVAP